MSFLTQVNESDESFAALCRRYGISRKTGYKWCDRYEEQGPRRLHDRQPLALTHPHRVADEQVDVIVALRKEHPFWGPKKLLAWLEQHRPEQAWPAASTMGDVLQRNGLIRPRRRRVRAPMSADPLAPTNQSNDTWCVDFKGHFALGDKTRCYPLTLTDQHSRYLLKCEAMTEPKFLPVQHQFELAFCEYGLPLRIRSDNGPPFASVGLGGLSQLSVWWIQHGIVPERIEPGQPQQNGRHERMHKTLKQETANPPAACLIEQQRVFDRFRHLYNWVSYCPSSLCSWNHELELLGLRFCALRSAATNSVQSTSHLRAIERCAAKNPRANGERMDCVDEVLLNEAA
jgi:transposase InsO family protein